MPFQLDCIVIQEGNHKELSKQQQRGELKKKKDFHQVEWSFQQNLSNKTPFAELQQMT